MAEDNHRGPSPKAYGRVTNPGRYRLLHERADDCLRELNAAYEVDRAEGPDDDGGYPGRVHVVRTVRLVPRGTGAPLTVGFTDFPGLIVRFGKWCVQAYPHCGCDACDEDPAALVREFNQRVDSVVRGQFQEQLTLSGWLLWGFDSPPSGGTRLGWHEAASRGAPEESTWSAWRPKTSA